MITKRKGYLYEQKFFSEALEHGLEVFVPLGDYLPQDCLVMNTAGKIFKVQVKGTESKSKDKARGGLGRYMVTTSSGTAAKETIDCTKGRCLGGICRRRKRFLQYPMHGIRRGKTDRAIPPQPRLQSKARKIQGSLGHF